jgi:hypothetical protein
LCFTSLLEMSSLVSLYLPPLPFALIGYIETKSELPARCTKATMVDLWAHVCHHSERCRPSLLQWVHGWVHPNGWSSLIDSPSETRSSSLGGTISITWCPSDASTMDISYPPFLYIVFFYYTCWHNILDRIGTLSTIKINLSPSSVPPTYTGYFINECLFFVAGSGE